MSLYSFTTETFTTFADLRRRPAVDAGQVLRLLAFFIAFAITLALVSHHSDAVASQPNATSLHATSIALRA